MKTFIGFILFAGLTAGVFNPAEAQRGRDNGSRGNRESNVSPQRQSRGSFSENRSFRQNAVSRNNSFTPGNRSERSFTPNRVETNRSYPQRNAVTRNDVRVNRNTSVNRQSNVVASSGYNRNRINNSRYNSNTYYPNRGNNYRYNNNRYSMVTGIIIITIITAGTMEVGIIALITGDILSCMVPDIRVLPRSYMSIYFGGYPYYYNDGFYYGYYGGYYQPIFPPFGFHIGVLPYGYYSFYLGGYPYYYYNGIYYQAIR